MENENVKVVSILLSNGSCCFAWPPTPKPIIIFHPFVKVFKFKFKSKRHFDALISVSISLKYLQIFQKLDHTSSPSPAAATSTSIHRVYYPIHEARRNLTKQWNPFNLTFWFAFIRRERKREMKNTVNPGPNDSSGNLSDLQKQRGIIHSVGCCTNYLNFFDFSFCHRMGKR